MKNYNRIFLALAAGALVSSCAETDIETYFPVEKPESIKETEYLLEYGNIKDMVDRAKYPNLKIACALGASDYINHNTYYRVANANFDEITLGNAMKYASVVGDDGSMNFNTISDLLDNAEAAGMSVYGHTLAWHAQQNVNFLNGCVSTKSIPSYEVGETFTYEGFDVYPYETTKVNPEIVDGNAVFDVTTTKNEFYLTDFFITEPGVTYTVKINIKGSKETSLPVYFFEDDDTKTKLPVTTDWNEVKLTFVPNSNTGYVLIKMGVLKSVKVEVESVKITHMTPSTRPLTDEEKVDTLCCEMNRWVDAMMEACAGRVKAWDMINEAVSGAGDVEGKYYTLQSAKDGGSDSFFWQDYLGNENYGPIVSKAAREAWKKYGGNEADLKLFVNDYNLESDWDDNKKLKSMIYWVNLWNSKGATIDGLASQMHISYYENKATMKSKAEHMVKMLHLMADTKMLVRISELDMGYVDLSGNDVKTENLTKEQHQNMANYYQFIIQMFLKIIPVDQQYSICQWCMTDSPSGSGWRANTPVGLWDLNWDRKPAYAAYCDAFTKDIPDTEDFFEYLDKMGLTHYVTPTEP